MNVGGGGLAPDCSRMGGPDFIVIGAQRAGTTWFYEVLDRHPAFWLPPIKELHFFDDPLSNNRERYYSFLRTRLTAGLGLKHPLSLWDVRYFLQPRGDEWYRRLFLSANKRRMLTGDITPSYATLDESAFRRMQCINPAVKIVFIMRDPVMRSWSSVLKSRRKHGETGLPTALTAIGHAQREGVVSKSSYVSTIEKLERVFAEAQIFYGFFDDIVAEPKTFITRVLSFLGCEPDDVGRFLPTKPVGSAAAGRRPPLEFERALAAMFLDDIRKLCQQFDGPPQKWLARYEAMLQESRLELRQASCHRGA